MFKILLIEDNFGIRENISEILSLENYTVLTANNGEVGLIMAKKEIPDLILCDIMMPEMDGYSVFSGIKADPLTEAIPFIFITAKVCKDQKCKSLDLGVEDYLIKPFDGDELLAIIRSRIEKSKKLKEKIETQRLSYIKELEDILHLISHKVRHPLCTNLGLMGLLDLSKKKSISNKDLKKIIEGIKSNTQLLGDFTNELTLFMHESVTKKRNDSK